MAKRAWNLPFEPALKARIQAAALELGAESGEEVSPSAWIAEACEMRLGSKTVVPPEPEVVEPSEPVQCSTCARNHRPQDPCCALCAETGGERHSIKCNMEWEDRS